MLPLKLTGAPNLVGANEGTCCVMKERVPPFGCEKQSFFALFQL
jgi:hypothetical protein